MDRGKGKIPTDKNQELLNGKNTLATKEGVNKDSIKQLISDKDAVKKDSAVKAVAEQGKGQEVRVPKLEGNDYYKNNPLPKQEKLVATPEKKGNPLKGVSQQIAKGIEEIADKASPFVDDAAKVIGDWGQIGGAIGSKALGVASAFYPESTATDEEMRLDELNAENHPEPTPQTPSLFSSNEERDEVFKTMASFETEKPDFLKDLEPDIEMDYEAPDMENPSMDGDEGSGGMDFDFD